MQFESYFASQEIEKLKCRGVGKGAAYFWKNTPSKY